ncbi:MAG: RecQ family ATP-dependent DNA helicase [Anaerolineaceae bacterium]|nr:RecQ family ATP-dependent DNA helicase [Anaerolineaceae bacterium]
MNPDLHTELKKYFGFSSFRPGQEEAIRSLLSGKHTVAVMPTGSGKSLIFQLAALHLPGITLVISPLIALMKDQVDSLERHRIPATLINSSISLSEQSGRLKRMTEGKYRIVYLAPERLRNARFLEVIKGIKVSLLAVDEAHCISEWGHDFRPDYLHIAKFREEIGFPITVALTATATPQVQTDISRLLQLDKPTLIVNGFNRPNLVLTVRHVLDPIHRYSVLRDALLSQSDGATIIYTGTRRDTEEVAEFVSSELGLGACYYHAGLDAEKRTQIQNDFIYKKLSVIVATNAFGMGIDRQDVRQVIHFSMPGSLESYYQEAGRAGRDGMPASALLLYNSADRALQEFFIRISTIIKEELLKIYKALNANNHQEIVISGETLSMLTGLNEIKIRVGLSTLEQVGIVDRLGDEGSQMILKKNEWHDERINQAVLRFNQQQSIRAKQLQSMIHYAESDQCRRNIILRYFGDKSYVAVDVCCDNCIGRKAIQKSTPVVDHEPDLIDPSLMILETIQQLRNGVGIVKIAQILKGSKNKDLLTAHLDKLPQYGKLSGVTIGSIRAMVEQLIKEQFVNVIGGEYPVLRLSHAGVRALQERTPIKIKTTKAPNEKKPAKKETSFTITNTVEQTYQLLGLGLSIEKIAAKRGMSPGTIYSHLMILIQNQKVNLEKILPKQIIDAVETAIMETNQVERLALIKERLPQEISYDVISCVVENWKMKKLSGSCQLPESSERPYIFNKTGNGIDYIVKAGNDCNEEAVPELIEYLHATDGNQRRLAASALAKIGNPIASKPLMDLIKIEDKPQVKQYAIKALGAIGEIIALPLLEKIQSDQNEKDYVRQAAKIAKKLINSKQKNRRHSNSSDEESKKGTSDESIKKFLSRDHPRQLSGPWDAGWALGFHSCYQGSEWTRSPVGELAFRLKYNGDFAVIFPLVQKIKDLIQDHPEIAQVDAIIPVPSSVQREKEPVNCLAIELAKQIKINYWPVLAKSRKTEQQKQFQTLAQKKANVANAFRLQTSIKGKRLLVVDDLFDSGTTLEEITKLLKQAGADTVNVLTITRTIHSEH